MLREDIKEEGGDADFTEDEARELFRMMKQGGGTDELSGALDSEIESLETKLNDTETFDDTDAEMFGDDANAEWLHDDSPATGAMDAEAMLDDDQKKMMQMIKSMGMGVDVEFDGAPEGSQDYEKAMAAMKQLAPSSSLALEDDANDMLTAHPIDDEEEGDFMLEELKAALPGLPERRVQKVADAFKESLSYPSLLVLTPILRENLPERVTAAWLQRKNVQNAHFVIQKATEDGLLDTHMMNGMLQVETSSGSIDRALACHEARFQQNGLTPTGYSDRLVLQMMIKNNRPSRALKFKEEVERSGRTLDPQSYGTLIAHYAKHRQVGSALMMLKECVAVHDSPPSEHSLNALRRLCRHQRLTNQVGLEELAGPDPLEWLRDGEATKKREMSRKGRREVLLPRNKSVNI